MKSIEHILFLETNQKRWGRYLVDTLLASVLAIIITIIVYIFKLYPKIPNVSFLYLLIVLGLASTRGLYAAIVASIVAFFTFDYFLVIPLFTFSIARPDEWLALFIFLVTAIITGQLASALRQRAVLATQRANEIRELYDLVNATTREETLEAQLDIVAQAIIKNFAVQGVESCSIFVPNERGRITPLACAGIASHQIHYSSDEIKTAEMVMTEGKVVDFYEETPATGETIRLYHYTRIFNPQLAGPTHTRMLPLTIGSRPVGVVRLLLSKHTDNLPAERNSTQQNERYNPQITYFWTFLDQAATIIDRARLHRETIQIELLQRTDQLRSALLSSVSHDLRTPLSSIKAAASSLLQEDVQWDEESKHSFLLAIEREADRLNRLVGNLLDMSRIEGGALKPEKEWYPIDELVHDVLGHLKTALQGREVQVSLPEELPPVELDYLQLDQVLTNLIENVLRYTPAGTPIDITGEVVDNQLRMSIGDKGPGIPPYDLERIFDKFYRVSGATRRATSSMGTGLGLAVCRGLIEAHGGRIWAENKPDGGALFRFTLPLGKAEGNIYE